LPEEEIEVAIVSPGIPIDHVWMQELKVRGVKAVPEVEWGAQFLEGEILAVTGSLGKTSMVMLAAEILKAAGYTVTVSGNIGVPVSEVAFGNPCADIHVIEVSSFQLESAREFHPQAALCLNLYPNHLDRHGSMDAYAAAKAKLFRKMDPGDSAWWPEPYPGRVQTQVARAELAGGLCPPLLDTVFEQGALRENLLRLLTVLRRWRLPEFDRLEEVIRGFAFPPHRLQRLDIPGAGTVIDDSKSTCLSATVAALGTVPGEVHLILGGLGKGEDLSRYEKAFAERAVSLYVIGDEAKAMVDAWSKAVRFCENCGTLDIAIQRSWARRDEGQSLLFSPGCASFDQFKNYEHRGNEFQRLVTLQAAKPH
jgi:UDP-N-acetylmuramoylalanine--D-glutamate ligase